MRFVVTLLLILFATPYSQAAEPESPIVPGPWQKPPKLGRPKGSVVRVRTVDELQAAVANARSNSTIMIEPGTYELTHTLHLNGGIQNVALRGASDERDKVIIKGRGMRNKDYGSVPHGIMVSNATDVLIANMSIGEVWNHPISLHPESGCQRVRMFNLRLFDAGEQFLKSNIDSKRRGVHKCTVEYCVFEYTDTAWHGYTQGMSVHASHDWVVRNNFFRNIRGPKEDASVGGCIDFWNGSRNTLVEGNVIVNARMGIRFGIVRRENGLHENEGGMVRNNIIWRQPGAVHVPDGGIMIWDSPGVKVINNTVILNNTFDRGVIEYRWSDKILIANNLIDGNVWKREETDGRESDNILLKNRDVFVDARKGDFRLSPKAATILRKLPLLSDCPGDIMRNKRLERTAPGAYEFVKDAGKNEK
jgi:hypothetical protein